MPVTMKTGAVNVKNLDTGLYENMDVNVSEDFAPINSPAFTGTPTVPTQAASDDSTKIATTAFVHDVVEGLSSDDIANDSQTVTGVNITSALNTLETQITSLDSSDITDNSTVGGSTVEASLTSLKGSLNTEVTARQTADNNIQGLITGYVETGATASRAYGKGQIIEVGGRLYVVIQPIASGASFTIGTNIVQTTIGNEFSNFVLVESALTFNNGSAFFYDGHIKANSKLFAGLSYLTPGSTSGAPRLYFVTVQPNIDGRAVVYIRNADGSVPSTIELTVYLIISNQV